MSAAAGWIVPDWSAPPRVRAFSTTRPGGTSEGEYASLNLGLSSGDDPLRVGANRAIVRAHRKDHQGMIEDFESTIRLGREIGQPTLELAGHYNLAEHLYWLNDAEFARVHVREAFATAARRRGCTRPPALALLDARVALSLGEEHAARDITLTLRAAGEQLSSSEDILCSMIELATERAGDDARDDAWDALIARSARESVGQERIEVLEARALFTARCGRIAEARLRLTEAIDVASRIPNVMGERLNRRLGEFEGRGSSKVHGLGAIASAG